MKPRTEVPSRAQQLRTRMARLVPDFGGYQHPGSRRDDDGRFRVELCERLDVSTVRLEDILLEISEEGWVPGMESIDQVIRDLDAIRERVTAGHDTSPDMPIDGADDEAVQRLLEKDWAILVELDSFQEHLAEVGNLPLSGRQLQEVLGELSTAVMAIEEAVSAREPFVHRVLLDAPGRLAA